MKISQIVPILLFKLSSNIINSSSVDNSDKEKYMEPNAVDLWKWSDLPADKQQFYEMFGWNEEKWDSKNWDGIEDDDFYKVLSLEWEELLPAARQHFETRGWTREKWNRDETLEERRDQWDDLDWEDDFTDDERYALTVLGWTEDSWNEDDGKPYEPPASFTKEWSQLTPAERAAASDVLGFTERNWVNQPALKDFSPEVTALPIPELEALNLDYFASLDDVTVQLHDGHILSDDEHCDFKTMTMKEYVTELRSGAESSVSKFYLKYEDEDPFKKHISGKIGRKVLQLLGDALADSPLRRSGKFSRDYDNLNLTDYNWSFWLGGANTTTPMHYDTDTLNFLWVAEGRKRVIMLPNDARTEGLYECQSNYKSHSCWTGVDLLGDFDSGTLPENAVALELGAGEGILFPHLCWHAVKNLEPTVAFGYRVDLEEYVI
mmetsp:Transcript_53725/g.64803  ORF Transcript_53725/g.64803 Transcript_53725/m.64803 type:complete len:434 (-) Transcript_53725:135-1436(-)|eukprot:CAMPEP_0172495476 /NCGR_PEP_ID=MMETSP1066-20121228/71401_1 /TAXON_ID=671091 /ORGANISM="Coscinodiscus wailesii, Strain CCMP2513" /LENGTH=433 /DNA_ID=CAMNT_0013267179 /DNA_START=85 /DNA_END=1386 /DNA_ORIENTATION=-